MGQPADVVNRYLDTMRTRDVESVRPLLADGYTYMDGSGEVKQGAQAALEVMETYLGAFADLNFEITNQWESGDTCVTEFVGRGTHTGDLAGIAPTGKKIEVCVCNICQVKDGKIVSEHEYFDNMALMSQLGLVPEQAQA